MEPNEITGTPPSNVREIPGRSEDTLQAARARLNETAMVLGRRASDAARYAEETVQSNPWTSVGAAFGVGILLGALIAIAAYSSRR
jgi:ElaB/YqjD/DUF883 family membrane-anchored ribosome-binding protein